LGRIAALLVNLYLFAPNSFSNAQYLHRQPAATTNKMGIDAGVCLNARHKSAGDTSMACIPRAFN
jgi:hypothetical protein